MTANPATNRAARTRSATVASLLTIAAVVGVGVAAGVGTFTAVRATQRAELVVEQDLPDDVATEVEATWQRFLTVFGPRRQCFDDVSLLLVGEVEAGDARYDVAEARIEIEIPTSPARFRESLVHELAHHVEHTCGAFASLRVELSALPGLEGRPWATGGRWQDIPAEVWAETVVEVVIGDRVRHGYSMPLPPGAVDAVERWATGP